MYVFYVCSFVCEDVLLLVSTKLSYLTVCVDYKIWLWRK